MKPLDLINSDYLQILDSLQDLVLVKGPNAQMLWGNRAFCDYYQMSNDQLQGVIDSKFNQPDYTAQYIKDDLYVFDTGKALKIEHEPVTKYDGTVRFFNTVKSPIFNPVGKVCMTVGILSFAKFGLEHVGQESPEVLKSYFAEIYQSGNRLMNLLSRLLDLSSLESNQIQYAFADHRLLDAVDPVTEEWLHEAQAKRLKIEVHHESPAVTAFFDLTRIRQVMGVLISNAVKFSYPDTVIHVRTVETDEQIVCSVSNRGTGISPDEVSKVFEKFAEGSRTRSSAGGLGLGLSIAKEIMNRHAGKIWVNSQINGETEFIFTLPK